MLIVTYSTKNARLRLATCLTLFVVVLGLISGCSRSLSEKEYIDKAKELQDKGELRGSIIALKNALAKNPQNVEARWLLGNIYIKAGLGQAAEKELREAERLGIDADAVKVPLGEALLMQNAFKKVLEQIQPSATSSVETRAKILRLQADAKVGLGQMAEGCALFQQSTSMYAKYAPAYWGLARCAMAHKDKVEAKRQIDAALKVDQTNPDTWVLLGDFDLSNDDLSAAETAYSKALQLSPNHQGALLHRAWTYVTQEKFELAKDDITILQKAMPDNPLLHYLQAAIQYGKGDYQASQNNLEEVFKTQPDYMPAVRLAGIVQYNLKQYEQAARNLGRYFGQFPGDLQVRKLLAAVYVVLGQGDEALKLLKPVLDAGKTDDYQLLALAGEAYLKNKDPVAAAKQFEKAAAINPKNVGLHTRLGISLLSAGETAQGTTEMENAVKLDSKDYWVDYALALTYLQQKQYEKALDTLAALEKKLPENSSILNLIGAVYIEKNDLVHARQSFEGALSADPASVAAAANLAQLDLLDKHPEAARKRFDGVFAKDKSNLRAMLVMASIAASQGKEQEYLDWLDKAAKANLAAVQPRLLMARYYLAKNQVQEALSHANDAVSAQPNDPTALEMLGAVQLAAGEKQNALSTYQRLVNQTPESPTGYFGLASAQSALERFPESRSSLNKALKLDPNYADAQHELALLDALDGKFAEALNIARHIQKNHPKSPRGLALEGDILMAQKQYGQAAKAYESAASLQNSWELSTRIYNAYSAGGERKKGEGRILKWLEVKPEDEIARLFLAQAYMLTAQNKAAIEQYQILLRQEPNNAVILNNLAWLHQQEKDTQALDFAERAYKLKPDAAFVLDTLGWILVEQGNLQRAQEVLRKGLDLSPKDVGIKYHLAVALARGGDKAGARKLLEELLATKQNFPQLQEAKKLLSQL